MGFMSSQEWSIRAPLSNSTSKSQNKVFTPQNSINGITISSSNINKYGPDRENQHPPLSWMDGWMDECMDG
jgi:hypothetical protein